MNYTLKGQVLFYDTQGNDFWYFDIYVEGGSGTGVSAGDKK